MVIMGLIRLLHNDGVRYIYGKAYPDGVLISGVGREAAQHG